MTPAQLAEEIPISAKQQSVLRKNNTFPIPYKKIGSKVYYSIYHVAEFLISGETSSHDEELPSPEPVKPKAKKQVLQKGNTVDLSHLFNLRAFVAHIQHEAQALTTLADTMQRYEKSYTLKQKLEQEIYIDDSEEVKKNTI